MDHLFNEVKVMYKDVNDMLGDIVKVTPSSKVVGDLAIFMVKNGLTRENILEKGKHLTYPDSAVSYFKGMMGQPVGGFPVELQKLVLKGEEPITVRPGEILEPVDFDEISKKLAEELNDEPNIRNILSYTLYPKVYRDYLKFLNEYGDLSNLESHVFFYGLNEGETCEIELEEGKIMIVKLIQMQKVDPEGYVTVVFEINGNRREIKIFDKAYGERNKLDQALMANPNDINEIGSSIPGVVSKILVQEGDAVADKQSLIIIEAMKMETNIAAPKGSKVERIHVKEGQQIQAGQLLIELA